MPRIFDNIEQQFLPTLRETIRISEKGDFCVGYFRLTGWRLIDDLIEQWRGGDGSCCRLIVGMQAVSQAEMRSLFGSRDIHPEIDQQTVLRLKKAVAQEFRDQLTQEAPNNEQEAGLRRLSHQLRASKVQVKVFLRYPLHAKLYMLHRIDPNNPSIGFLGSSNLTYSGLAKQGELNVDVLDHDSCIKLQKWFDERWEDQWCLDVSLELAEIIDQSWAREVVIPPYHIYLKIAYHLAREARNGLAEFQIPRDFGNKMFDFQSAAVKIASHHLNKRGGVLLGDVVGLGKTLMATAVARIFQDDQRTETLIICPKNLVPMWEDYVHRYRLFAAIVPISQVQNTLPDLRRYRLVIIDESHNLRNREGKRFRVIQDYVRQNDSRCILLSATPYNKSYLDLSSQLRIFLADDKDVGIRPEAKIQEIGETQFIRLHQCSPRSLSAFEKSDIPDDWRDLMRLFLVRRTRTFIKQNYAEVEAGTNRRYLLFEDGSKSYFPERIPKTIRFETTGKTTKNQYEILYSNDSGTKVANLNLPRYGLGNYVRATHGTPLRPNEERVLVGLSRAGKRLTGVCRTNLFKRLESGGPAFIISIERHILRNFVFIYALENNLELPIGPQSADLFDAGVNDEDGDDLLANSFELDGEEKASTLGTGIDYQSRESLSREAARIYGIYVNKFRGQFQWLRPLLFVESLKNDLETDARLLSEILSACGKWDARTDNKLAALERLLKQQHRSEKVIIFTQFADTVKYLTEQLQLRGVDRLEGVTGESEDPAKTAWRFSPISNDKRKAVPVDQELRVLVTTDVLSEGFNLQDGAIIVNFDLPWAIIRLVQRAGRVDRIGQNAEKIICYSFMPAEGIERILGLRAKVRDRLRQNAEVVGTDESFFEGDSDDQPILDIYNEHAGVLDDDGDGEVDLASFAYQIWKNAIDRDPTLNSIIPALPPVAYSSKDHHGTIDQPEGVLVYTETGDGTDALALIDRDGNNVTQSQFKILEMAKCEPGTPATSRSPLHHELVAKGLEHIKSHLATAGGQLGRPSGARFKTYERLKSYRHSIGDRRNLMVTDAFVVSLERVLDEVYNSPLRQSAVDAINRQIKSGVDDETLANLVIALRDDDRLCIVRGEQNENDLKIICSLGLFGSQGRD